MKNLKKLTKFFSSYKLWTFLGSSLIFFEVIMDLFLPSIMSNIVNNGIGKNDLTYIIANVILMFILSIIGLIGGIFSTYFAAKVTGYVSHDIRVSLFKKITKLSFLKLDTIKVEHIITVLTNDLSMVSNIFMMGIRILFRVPIILIGSLIMAIVVSPTLSLSLIVVVPLMISTMYFVMKKSYPYFDLTQKAVDDINDIVRENVNGIRVVKAFVKEKEELKKFEKVNKKLLNINMKAMKIMTIAMPIMMLIVNVTVVLILWYGGNNVVNGNIEIGNILAFIQYLSNILSSVMMGSLIIVMLAKSEVSALRINEVLELKEENMNGNLKQKISGKINFKNVYFSYKEATGDMVLKNISFNINKGELVGIIGPTGSGKTSLINLLLRFYDISEGEIILDENINLYDVQYLRSEIGLAMQQPSLFSGTISDNIKMGNKAKKKDIIKFSKIACADDFIQAKKNKYNYVVEQKGTNLSGGEKQRISLARTLAKDPSIIILDDATSAIDLKTEKTILNNIKKSLKDKTVIMISSRVASIINSDKILVIEDGTIKGIGTHIELLKTNKFYQDIYYSQIEGVE